MEPTTYPRLSDEQRCPTLAHPTPVGPDRETRFTASSPIGNFVRRGLQGNIHLYLTERPKFLSFLLEQVTGEMRVMRDAKRALHKSFGRVPSPRDIPPPPTALTDSSHG
ncbi:hypothetical protein CGRA01v4_06455 [Colletotrichum graminicola]|nr:hypothetical protein CGRA01v4_06455 [Colletotrichum graminicola]